MMLALGLLHGPTTRYMDPGSLRMLDLQLPQLPSKLGRDQMER